VIGVNGFAYQFDFLQLNHGDPIKEGHKHMGAIVDVGTKCLLICAHHNLTGMV
jgi:hypothetical protein